MLLPNILSSRGNPYRIYGEIFKDAPTDEKKYLTYSMHMKNQQLPRFSYKKRQMKAFDISNKPIISNDYVLLQEVENSIIANAEKMNQNRQLNIPVEYYLIDFKILIFDEMI